MSSLRVRQKVLFNSYYKKWHFGQCFCRKACLDLSILSHSHKTFVLPGIHALLYSPYNSPLHPTIYCLIILQLSLSSVRCFAVVESAVVIDHKPIVRQKIKRRNGNWHIPARDTQQKCENWLAKSFTVDGRRRQRGWWSKMTDSRRGKMNHTDRIFFLLHIWMNKAAVMFKLEHRI
jgi:hypothetical protein